MGTEGSNPSVSANTQNFAQLRCAAHGLEQSVCIQFLILANTFKLSISCLSGVSNPRMFCYFKTSQEIIRLAVMMYVRYELSLRSVEDLLHERGIDITHETVRFW